MNNARSSLPSITSLLAFERFARLGHVTRAAEELNTSQAAVSRHLKNLEAILGVALVKPEGRGLTLTPQGHFYFNEISSALSQIRDAGAQLKGRSDELVVACTHEVSHLILMPRYSALKKALGRRSHVRIVTCEYGALPRVIDTGIDISFSYSRSGKGRLSTEILREELMPVASPDFFANNRDRLLKGPVHWRGIPRISLTKDNSGWATWNDWYRWQGLEAPGAATPAFDNYVYALEAAARGEGLVLAWRWFADEYLNSGRLVSIGQNWLKSDASLLAIQTDYGASNPLARKFVSSLSKLL